MGWTGRGAQGQHCSTGVVGAVAATTGMIVADSASAVVSVQGARWDRSQFGRTGERRT